MELMRNQVFYIAQLAHIVGPLDVAVRSIVRNFSFSELYEVAALSRVLRCNVRSVYPSIDYRQDLNLMNRTFEHEEPECSAETIFLFWTHMQSERDVRSRNNGSWTPNHFVPLLLPPDNELNQMDITQTHAEGTDTVSLTYDDRISSVENVNDFSRRLLS
jgi:hypothetical protein